MPPHFELKKKNKNKTTIIKNQSTKYNNMQSTYLPCGHVMSDGRRSTCVYSCKTKIEPKRIIDMNFFSIQILCSSVQLHQPYLYLEMLSCPILSPSYASSFAVACSHFRPLVHSLTRSVQYTFMCILIQS